MNGTGIKTLAFSDKIIIYWDRAENFQQDDRYLITYDNGAGYTTKTHYEISKVSVGQNVSVTVTLVNGKGETVRTIGETSITVPAEKKRLDVTKAPYFAVGDGKTLNTTALQRAFDDCTANDCVYIPKGVFLTGALNMHGNSELYVDTDGVLQGTANPEDYLPKMKSRFEGWEMMCYRSLINIGDLDSSGGYTTKNIVIRGKGAILGGGKALMDNSIMRETGRSFVTPYDMDEIERCAWRTRGRLLHIANTQNVVMYGLEMGMGPAWNIHMIYSDDIITANCYIHSEHVHNGDGWDPDSSTNCTLFDCKFKTRDDMVAIKSGKNPEGNVVNRPSKHIRVFDCVSLAGHGLAIGSEMSGGVEDVSVWDCDIEQSFCGLEIKATKKRGGYVKNVRMYHCKCPVIAVHSVGYNDEGEGAKTLPVFEDFHFEDVEATGVCIVTTGEKRWQAPIKVCGFSKDNPAKNITLKNVKIRTCKENPHQTVEMQFAENVSFENVIYE